MPTSNPQTPSSNVDKKQDASAKGKLEKVKKQQVEQTKDDRDHNYDIDGVSMDSQGVRVATDETH